MALYSIVSRHTGHQFCVRNQVSMQLAWNLWKQVSVRISSPSSYCDMQIEQLRSQSFFTRSNSATAFLLAENRDLGSCNNKSGFIGFWLSRINKSFMCSSNCYWFMLLTRSFTRISSARIAPCRSAIMSCMGSRTNILCDSPIILAALAPSS